MGGQYFVNASVLNSLVRFLIDTGSQICTIQRKFVPKNCKINSSSLVVNSFNNSAMKVEGFIEAAINIDSVSWGKAKLYVVPDEFSSILGSNFLEGNDCLVNLKRRKMIQAGPITRHANL